MKKSFKLFAFAVLAIVAFSTTSCKKCQTCELEYNDGTIQVSNTICSDKDAMTQSKDDCNTTADADPSLTCHCSVAFSFN